MRILAAMSGGVDSSVAAALLREQGYDVTGAYMKNWINEENILGDCPWQQDIEDARAASEKIGMEFHVVNLMRDYRERVVHYLLEGYRSGVTPNPDVMCNREMKFGVFLQWAKEQGFDAVATGHYSQRNTRENGMEGILRGADPNKDQTYFLSLLRQDQVQHALFPIGHLLKSEVRDHALRFGLPNAGKKDSQGICFIGNVKMRDFLSTFLEDDPGPIVGTDGKILGEHRGLHLYTLGQRKGLGVPSNTYQEAYVVVGKRAEDKALVVAFDHPDSPGLYAQRIRLHQPTFLSGAVVPPTRVRIQPRYRAPAVSADIIEIESGIWEVSFEKSQRALTPGQIGAIYDEDTNRQLLGGGVFGDVIH